MKIMLKFNERRNCYSNILFQWTIIFQIFEILKQAMCRKIQDDEKRKSSAWLRSVLSDDWQIVDVVEHVIANRFGIREKKSINLLLERNCELFWNIFFLFSNKDRHLVLQGLVDFAFVLMDSDNRLKTDDHHLSDLGIRIVQKLIRKRHEIGATVLRTLTDKIVSGGSAIAQYTGKLYPSKMTHVSGEIRGRLIRIFLNNESCFFFSIF